MLRTFVCVHFAALMVTDEKQHQKWCNYILLTSWDCLKLLAKRSFTEHQALSILDEVLATVTKIRRMKRIDQVCPQKEFYVTMCCASAFCPLCRFLRELSNSALKC